MPFPRLTTPLAGLAVAALLAVGPVPGAQAAPPAEGDCAKQQAQVDRAAAKLERLQDVFAKAKREVRKAKKAAAQAETEEEQAEVEEDLDDAK